jgi:MoaA/NifB/PqqE/SkfB family radical SAM enzyme
MSFPLWNLLENTKRAMRLIRIINFNPRCSLGPLSIEVSLTTACNFKCYFCNAHSHLREKCSQARSLPDEVIDCLLEDAHLLKIQEILFSGDGEPFLHKRFLEILDACRGCKVKIVTNGSKLEQVSASIFANIHKLTISLNSMDSETHQLIHGYSGDSKLPHILENIERLLSLPRATQKLQINYVVTKENLKELESVFQLSHKWNVFFAARPVSIGFDELQPRELTTHQMRSAQEKIRQISQEPSLSPNAIASLKYSRHYFRTGEAYKARNHLLPCYAGFYSAYLESNGDYLICVHCKEPMGNINRQRLAKLWRSNQFQERLYAASLMHENNTKTCSACVHCPDVETYSMHFHRFFSRIPGQMFLLKHRYQKYSDNRQQTE